MANDGHFDSFQDFLAKMDAGEFDGTFSTELKKLTKEQLEHLAEVLVKRDAKSDRRQKGASGT